MKSQRQLDLLKKLNEYDSKMNDMRGIRPPQTGAKSGAG